MMRRALACVALLLLAGCGGTVVDVGSDKPPIGVDAGSGDGLEGWPSDAVCRRGTQLPIVGAWEGYMEDRNLTPNSDVIKLVSRPATVAAITPENEPQWTINVRTDTARSSATS